MCLCTPDCQECNTKNDNNADSLLCLCTPDCQECNTHAPTRPHSNRVSVLQIVRSATLVCNCAKTSMGVSVLQIVRSATLMIVYFTYSVNYVTYNTVKSVTSQYFSLNSTKVFPIPVNSGSYGSLQIKYLSPYNDVISSIPPILSTILSYLVIHN